MSVNRENVTWQSKDGTWNLGFWEVIEGDTSDPDYDYEWDVEYGSEFEWVSTGHRTQESADRSWRGANPGGGWIVSQANGKAEAASLDNLAWRFNNPEGAKKQDLKTLRAKIRKVVKDKGISSGSYAHITYSSSAAIGIEQWNSGWSVTGVLLQEGDWMVMVNSNREHIKVFNTKTNTPHPKLTGISCREEQKRLTGRNWNMNRRW